MKNYFCLLPFIFLVLVSTALAEETAESLCQAILAMPPSGDPIMAIWNPDFSFACAAVVVGAGGWDASLFCIDKAKLQSSNKDEINSIGANNVLFPSQTIFYIPFTKTNEKFAYIVPTVNAISGGNKLRIKGHDYAVKAGLDGDNPNSWFILNKDCYITEARILAGGEKYIFGQEDPKNLKKVKVPKDTIILYKNGELFFEFPGNDWQFGICFDNNFQICKDVKINKKCDVKLGKSNDGGVIIERIKAGEDTCFDVDGHKITKGRVSVFPDAVRYEAGSSGTTPDGLKINAYEPVYSLSPLKFCTPIELDKKKGKYNIGSSFVDVDVKADNYAIGCDNKDIIKLNGKCFDVEVVNPIDYEFNAVDGSTIGEGSSLRFFMGERDDKDVITCSPAGSLTCKDSLCTARLEEGGTIGFTSCNDKVDFEEREGNAVMKKPVEGIGQACVVLNFRAEGSTESYTTGTNNVCDALSDGETSDYCKMVGLPCLLAEEALNNIAAYGGNENEEGLNKLLNSLSEEEIKAIEACQFEPMAAAPKKIVWANSVKEGLDANKDKKPLMIFFWQDGCGYCDQMEKVTFTDARIVELSSRFICVKTKDKADADAYKVPGYPTVVFTEKDGKEVGGFPNGRVMPYVEPDRFVKIMNLVLGMAKPKKKS